MRSNNFCIIGTTSWTEASVLIRVRSLDFLARCPNKFIGGRQLILSTNGENVKKLYQIDIRGEAVIFTLFKFNSQSKQICGRYKMLLQRLTKRQPPNQNIAFPRQQRNAGSSIGLFFPLSNSSSLPRRTDGPISRRLESHTVAAAVVLTLAQGWEKVILDVKSWNISVMLT